MRRTPLPPDALDYIDRQLINSLQEGIPLAPRPFTGIAAALGLDEAEVLARIAQLRELGAITRFGPFLDAAAMGGAFCLCAMEVPAPCLHCKAPIIGSCFRRAVSSRPARF